MLEKLFGPSKDEIWTQLATQMEGNFIDGGFWGQDKVEVKYQDWVIILDTHIVSTGKTSVIYTRLRAPFLNNANFKFSISRRNIFKDIGKFFGMQDIEIGHPDFDDEFIIQGNDVTRVQTLLDNQKLRQLIQEQPHLHFSTRDSDNLFTKFPEGISELYFQQLGIVKDLDRLKSLYNLFSETLDQLYHIGVASKKPADS